MKILRYNLFKNVLRILFLQLHSKSYLLKYKPHLRSCIAYELVSVYNIWWITKIMKYLTFVLDTSSYQIIRETGISSQIEGTERIKNRQNMHFLSWPHKTKQKWSIVTHSLAWKNVALKIPPRLLFMFNKLKPMSNSMPKTFCKGYGRLTLIKLLGRDL